MLKGLILNHKIERVNIVIIMVQEFQAYKKHSTEVLKQERDLNSKLRHFTE